MKKDKGLHRKEKEMKYPPLQEPCKSCIGKCGRVEELNFISDKNCKYAEKEEWKQEEIWKN